MPSGGTPALRSRIGERARLVLLSFLMLFVELMLIRWSAAYVLHVAYFTNLVLLASFLGIGVGFLRHRDGRAVFHLVPLMLGAYLLLVFVLLRAEVTGAEGRTTTGLFGAPALPAVVAVPLVFLGVAAVMAAVADGVARIFVRFRPLEAYRLDIAGSLFGVAAFATISLLGMPPVVWGAVVVALVAFTTGRRSRIWIAGVILVLAVTAISSLAPGERWSPYYRVSVLREGEGVVRLRVNGLPHQAILPLDVIGERQPFYLFPYRHLEGNPLENVLVVGSGSGNDVAVALRMGAGRVDAVEIDPVIRSVGSQENPDRPYQDPRVASFVDDGRAFLRRSTERYDLIVFALPDSLTLVTGQSSLRLESYLFTVEALREVRRHLTDGGAFTMYNYYRPDVFDRFAQTITDAFGHRPCIDARSRRQRPRAQAVLTIGRVPGTVACDSIWAPPAEAPNVATDDHPFPYLRGRTIPTFYLLAFGLVLLGSLALVRRFGTTFDVVRRHADLFFMGAAFLLLETKSVVGFSLLFGTTWIVNAFVFAGVLLAVLAAVQLADRVRLPRPAAMYVLLAGSLVLAWAVPAGSLLSLSPAVRFATAVVISFAPILLANLVFAQRFRDADSAPAFGTNLLGAMVGGVLEYGALVVGYRNLLVLALVLYGLAFATTPIRRPIKVT